MAPERKRLMVDGITAYLDAMDAIAPRGLVLWIVMRWADRVTDDATALADLAQIEGWDYAAEQTPGMLPGMEKAT